MVLISAFLERFGDLKMEKVSKIRRVWGLNLCFLRTFRGHLNDEISNVLYSS